MVVMNVCVRALGCRVRAVFVHVCKCGRAGERACARACVRVRACFFDSLWLRFQVCVFARATSPMSLSMSAPDFYSSLRLPSRARPAASPRES